MYSDSIKSRKNKRNLCEKGKNLERIKETGARMRESEI